MRRFFGVRLTAVSSLLAGLLALVPGFPASATGASNSTPGRYLALGDSVPFGFSPQLVQSGVNPSVFVSYPQLVANLFTPKLKVFNASCPGETSTSLISGTGPDNGCQNFRQFVGALHMPYPGSQLQYAENYVAVNLLTKFISLTIWSKRHVPAAGQLHRNSAPEGCQCLRHPRVAPPSRHVANQSQNHLRWSEGCRFQR
jgi:hypothetical protein